MKFCRLMRCVAMLWLLIMATCFYLSLGVAFAQNKDDSPKFNRLILNEKNLAVISGYATPHSNVELLNGARKLGETQSDQNGNFTIMLDTHLGSGQYRFVLRATEADGKSVTSVETAMILVPENKNNELVAMVQSLDGSRRFISGKPDVMNKEQSLLAGFGIDRIMYKKDNLTISGHGPYSMQIIISLGQKNIGAEKVHANGSFVISRPMTLKTGDHVFKIDLINEAGEVISTIGVPFEIMNENSTSSQIYQDGKAVRTTFVEPNETLLSISKRLYGDDRFAQQIFDLNRNKIDNPNHIDVGQELLLPNSSEENLQNESTKN